jgi:glutathione S-transferase
MALAVAQSSVELREVWLREKPAAMLAASPKGSVPVLVIDENAVLDESLDIMRWALEQHDPFDWLASDKANTAAHWITENDGEFKHWLDRYKYADRFPEESVESYRQRAEAFLQRLESALQCEPWLGGARRSLVDVALFPFIRQFAGVDRDWFDQAPYPALQRWLESQLSDPLFESVMRKYPRWTGETPGVTFPPAPPAPPAPPGTTAPGAGTAPRA